MQKLFITLFILVAFSVFGFGQSYSRCKVSLEGKSIADLAQLGVETDHGALAEGKSFTTDFSAAEIQTIRNAGFAVEILIPDVQKWYVDQNTAPTIAAERGAAPCGGVSNSVDVGNYPIPQNYTTGSMGGYPTYAEMLAILDDMHAKYPQFISARAIVSDTITTHEGRPLYWVRISDNPDQDENEPEALYTALHHCREPIGLTQLLYFMWHLMENYDSSPECKYVMDNTELYFIPCVNPDGYLFNESTNPQGGGLWRKNMRDNGDGTFGVDLNRNYGFSWGYDDIGSSPNPNSATYRGPFAFSEPESRMVRDFCNKHDFKNTLNYHTYGNLLIYPWAYSDSAADPYLPFLGNALTEKNKFKAGTTTETVGYAVNGSSDDWMFENHNTYSFTPETGPAVLGFWPPANVIDSLNKMTQLSNFILAWSMLKIAFAKDISNFEINTITSTIPIEVRNVGAQNGNFTVSLQKTDNQIASISPANYSINLNNQQVDTVWFTVNMNPNSTINAVIPMLLQITNGAFTLTDTLEKIYTDGPRVAILNEPFNNPQNWTGNWLLTTESYTSAPTSITDSPNAKYSNNSLKTLLSNNFVTIPSTAMLPALNFDAKWSLETDYDWVQLEVITESGVSTQMCGKYTNLGTNNQTLDLPLWDGLQETWVKESIDLSDFKGQKVKFKFSLLSDQGLNLDGFYIDNFEVNYVDTTLNTPSNINQPFVELYAKIQPNPATNQVQLTWNSPITPLQNAHFVLANALGQQVKMVSLPNANNGSFQIDLSNCPEGIYYWCIKMENGATASQKLVVTRQ